VILSFLGDYEYGSFVFLGIIPRTIEGTLILHNKWTSVLPKSACHIPSADGSPTIPIPKKILAFPSGNSALAIRAVSSQYEHFRPWKITVVVVVLDECFEKDVSRIITILTGLALALGHVRHFVIVIEKSSCFFDIDSKTSSSSEQMRSLLSQTSKFNATSETAFCDAVLRQFSSDSPGALRSLTVSLYDKDSWNWCDRTIPSDTGPADRRLHLNVLRAGSRHYSNIPTRLAILRWASFFDGYCFSNDEQKQLVDFSKCDRLISMYMRGKHGEIILPQNPFMLESIMFHGLDVGNDCPLVKFGPVYPRLRRLTLPLCLRTCSELDSERFPVLRRIETCELRVPSSLNLSGISTGGLKLVLNSPLVDIKLPDEPLGSLSVERGHILDMTAGDALCRGILSTYDLSLGYSAAEDLILCIRKISGTPPVAGQPITVPHLRRLELRGNHSSLDMSLLNLPSLQHLKLYKSNVSLRSENFPFLETIECYYCNITLIGDFPKLRSLDMRLGTLNAESKFTAPLLQELAFCSVNDVNILHVGRSAFPSLQLVSITQPATDFGPVEDRHIPRLIGNAELDCSPSIVLRADFSVNQAIGKILRDEVPGWIAFSPVCTLPENAALY